MEDKKVFISYSWAVQKKVIELAKRLIANGIEVIVDVYDLKEGQDKYSFMEQSVNDKTIDKVLIICDKTYTEKSNNRKGGVGDETIIISPEVYDQINQEKFIPVIFEVDENCKPYCPYYIKSRLYIDLSTEDDRYEIEFEKLIRNIYNKPLYTKPTLGTKPEWLNNNTVDLSAIRDSIKQIRGYTGENNSKIDFLTKKCIEQFSEAALNYKVEDLDRFLLVIDSTKPLKDIFADFCEVLVYSSLNISDILCDFFEMFYNKLHDTTVRTSYMDADFELYDFLIWEFFLTSTAILLYYEKFTELYNMISHTYFLINTFHNNSISTFSYYKFRKYFNTIETYCKPKFNFNNHITLAGKILIEREKKPIITKESISNADLVLFQLGRALKITDDSVTFWFPNSYVYHERNQLIWQKLKSKLHCKKIMPLFNVSNIEELKELINNLTLSREIGYSESYFNAPEILSSIKISEIGTLN